MYLRHSQTFGIFETISYVTPAANTLSCTGKHINTGQYLVPADHITPARLIGLVTIIFDLLTSKQVHRLPV